MTSPTAPAAAPLSEAEDRQWASIAHLGGILGPLPSLIIWLVFKDRGSFTNNEAKEALNFQITLIIAYLVGGILTIIGVGFILLFVTWVSTIVFGILAAVASSRGEPYRYPVNIRMIS